MVPVALAVVGDVYPEGRRARALGTLGAIETMGWVWGPLYGAMLVRFLSWEWQFWLNIPLAIAGVIASWWALADHDRPDTQRSHRLARCRTAHVTLVALNVALLGSAEIQSVNGSRRADAAAAPTCGGCYLVALVAGALPSSGSSAQRAPAGRPTAVPRSQPAGRPVRQLRRRCRARDRDGRRAAVHQLGRARPRACGGDRRLGAVGVDRGDGGDVVRRRSADRADVVPSRRCWSACRCRPRRYAWMGATWEADTSYVVFALQLALLGAGFGLTVAPTTSAVVDARRPINAVRPHRS